MSLEQSLNQKLSIIDKEPSSASASSHSHSQSLSPNPGVSPIPTSPSGEKRISFKDDQLQSSITVPSYSNSSTTNHKSAPVTPTSPNLNKSRNPSTSSTGSDKPSSDKDKSVKVTRKVFNTWRSVCNKKTKDLFKRWKTLPEHQTEFDDLINTPFEPGTSGRNGADTPPTQSSSSGISKIRMLVKKHSEDQMPSSMLEDTQKQRSTGWTVHVWSTYVQRGSCDDEANTEETQPGRDFLSDFQKVKLTHFFRHVLDMNHDDVISASDFVALNNRIRHYVEWSSECIEFHILKEVHSGFLECFLNQPLDDCSVMYYCDSEKETREKVDIDQWLDIWGNLLKSVTTLDGLPLWLQYFPKILFQVINKSGSGIISREQLRAFYTMFLGIDFQVVNETLDSIYSAMTDKGVHQITYGLYKLCFANFLFGKFPHGPGQYLFGICSEDSLNRAFPIDYSALNTSKDDLEPFDPSEDTKHSNRRSVIV